jgi:hypothetical protein
MTEQGPQGMSPADPATEAQRIAGTVLVRIAVDTADETAVARDVLPLMGPQAAADIGRIEVARLVAALVAGGLVERSDEQLRATARGLAAALEFLGAKKGLPATWQAARDVSLVAKALDLTAGPQNRLKLLGKADGLRVLLVAHRFNLKIKGLPTASRVRSALAGIALEQAFGNRNGQAVTGKSVLPPKAGRMLAGQLSTSGREFGTDGRLMAALAAEAVGLRRGDLAGLRLAVLRRFLGRGDAPVSQDSRRSRMRRADRRRALGEKAGLGVPRPTTVQRASDSRIPAAGVAQGNAAERPDPEAFAEAVLAATAETAEGWAGNRKAFISKVWDVLCARHAEWALTEIEFKCMLTEAHRTGLIALANADLKDKRALKELQDSAVVYKNTVWHYVRAAD